MMNEDASFRGWWDYASDYPYEVTAYVASLLLFLLFAYWRGRVARNRGAEYRIRSLESDIDYERQHRRTADRNYNELLSTLSRERSAHNDTKRTLGILTARIGGGDAAPEAGPTSGNRSANVDTDATPDVRGSESGGAVLAGGDPDANFASYYNTLRNAGYDPNSAAILSNQRFPAQRNGERGGSGAGGGVVPETAESLARAYVCTCDLSPVRVVPASHDGDITFGLQTSLCYDNLGEVAGLSGRRWVVYKRKELSCSTNECSQADAGGEPGTPHTTSQEESTSPAQTDDDTTESNSGQTQPDSASPSPMSGATTGIDTSEELRSAPVDDELIRKLTQVLIEHIPTQETRKTLKELIASTPTQMATAPNLRIPKPGHAGREEIARLRPVSGTDTAPTVASRSAGLLDNPLT